MSSSLSLRSQCSYNCVILDKESTSLYLGVFIPFPVCSKPEQLLENLKSLTHRVPLIFTTLHGLQRPEMKTPPLPIPNGNDSPRIYINRSLRQSPSPTRHHTVCKTQGPSHDRLTILDSGAGLRAREPALRTQGFRVWWGEGGEGPEVERLPEAGPSARWQPSESRRGVLSDRRQRRNLCTVIIYRRSPAGSPLDCGDKLSSRGSSLCSSPSLRPRSKRSPRVAVH